MFRSVGYISMLETLIKYTVRCRKSSNLAFPIGTNAILDLSQLMLSNASEKIQETLCFPSSSQPGPLRLLVDWQRRPYYFSVLCSAMRLRKYIRESHYVFSFSLPVSSQVLFCNC